MHSANGMGTFPTILLHFLAFVKHRSKLIWVGVISPLITSTIFITCRGPSWSFSSWGQIRISFFESIKSWTTLAGETLSGIYRVCKSKITICLTLSKNQTMTVKKKEWHILKYLFNVIIFSASLFFAIYANNANPIFWRHCISWQPTYTDKIFSRPIFASFTDKTWSRNCHNFPTSFATMLTPFVKPRQVLPRQVLI